MSSLDKKENEHTTVYDLLRSQHVGFDVLRKKHLSLLLAVRKIIGVTPNCDKFLEIWPSAFTTYNAIVPTFLDLPTSFLGVGAPLDMLGIALYYSSIQSGCGYCTLHTCFFALARGVPRSCILGPKNVDDLPPKTRAVARLAVGLASVPAQVSMRDREAVRDMFNPHDAEHVVLACCMMGFLNKMMDTTGIDMEAAPVRECGELLRSTGYWSTGKFAVAEPDSYLQAVKDGLTVDTMKHRISIVPLFPALAWNEIKVQWRVPSGWPAAGEWLAERIGHRFPVLAHLRSGRARRTIACVLEVNLNPARLENTVPTALKCLAGVVFAVRAQNAPMAQVFTELAAWCGVPSEAVDALREAANRGLPDPVGAATQVDIAEGVYAPPSSQASSSGPDADAREEEREKGVHRLVLVLAHFCAASPADLSPALVTLIGRRLSAQQTVETFNWLSVMGMLQRLYAYYIPEACPQL